MNFKAYGNQIHLDTPTTSTPVAAVNVPGMSEAENASIAQTFALSASDKPRQTKLYQELASRIQARQACAKNGNTERFEKHTNTIGMLLDLLPHGSGLDGVWKVDYEKSHENKIVLNMGYHAMDENGFYDGWIDFTLTILPSLISEITLHIRGTFGKYQDVKDMLYEDFDYALTRTINRDTMTVAK